MTAETHRDTTISFSLGSYCTFLHRRSYQGGVAVKHQGEEEKEDINDRADRASLRGTERGRGVA